MRQVVPPKWIDYVSQSSLLEQSAYWETLREWSLSNVQRVTLDSGTTVIAKMGHESMAGELDVYQSLLEPLQLPRPDLLEVYDNETSNILIMADLGRYTVEMDPQQIHFVNAAKKLAEIRDKSVEHLDSLSPSVYKKYLKSQESVLQELKSIKDCHTLFSPEELDILNTCLDKLPQLLDDLYRNFSITITHNDYNTKNLMITNQSIIPIDWSNAYLSPHLGDLYCLLEEAERFDVDQSAVIEAYSEEVEKDCVEWEIQVGGICWLIHGLCWVCEEGIHKVPASRSWIPDMILSINDCLKKI
ncbi:phosphotransferase family enzyme [Aquisalibacillus elongatus]|uniref:Phosphotransferase family enzyme n=1 Tax=Aquisalibacillus elongatus TaxID=485577 RepID=A0A3N5BWY2_9BACI|nr:phosphotransferase family enzyme [Aquisalibacillus elongatus]